MNIAEYICTRSGCCYGRCVRHRDFVARHVDACRGLGEVLEFSDGSAVALIGEVGFPFDCVGSAISHVTLE